MLVLRDDDFSLWLEVGWRGGGATGGKGPNVSSMVDGELRSRTETTAAAFSRSPKGRPEHAPPPPRPLGRFGGNVAVIADRSV